MNSTYAGIRAGHSTIVEENSIVVFVDEEKSRREDYDFQNMVSVNVEYQNLPLDSTLHL